MINEGVRLFLPLRGGSYYNDDNAGLAALNLNYERDNANDNVGFRPALACSRIRCAYVAAFSAQAKGALLLCLIARIGNIGIVAASILIMENVVTVHF